MNFLTAEEAAARFRMSKKTFLKLGVPVCKMSDRKFLYSEEVLDAWARSRLEYPEQTAQGERPQRRKAVKPLRRSISKVLSPGDLRNLGQEGRG